MIYLKNRILYGDGAFYILIYFKDGYQLVVNNITNCNNENTLKVGNLTVVLNENCTATTNGCISTKGYTTARVHIIIFNFINLN